MSPFNDRRSGGRGGFRRGGGGGGRRDFGDREFHSATCATCGETCKVPFKPTGEKPVYCSNCFKREDNDRPRSFRDSRDGTGRRFEPRSSGGGSGVSKYDIDQINGKLDRILRALGEND